MEAKFVSAGLVVGAAIGIATDRLALAMVVGLVIGIVVGTPRIEDHPKDHSMQGLIADKSD